MFWVREQSNPSDMSLFASSYTLMASIADKKLEIPQPYIQQKPNYNSL